MIFCVHFRTFRSNVVQTIAAATIDSGSENDFRENMSYKVNKSRATTPLSLSTDGPMMLSGSARQGSVSSSMSLSRGKSGAFGMFDGRDLGSSGVLRRSVTDYESEHNEHEGHIYNRSVSRHPHHTVITKYDVILFAVPATAMMIIRTSPPFAQAVHSVARRAARRAGPSPSQTA